MAPVIAPVQPRKRSTAQGRKTQYDRFGRPFISEVTQGPGFDLTPAAGPVAPAPFSPTVENPATDEQIARAFYGPSQPGAPPPPMTQAQYQARKAAGFQSEGAVPPMGGMANTTLTGFPRPVQAPRAMSKQEIDAALRLMETTGNMNPAGRPGVRIDGQEYQPLGRPGYGDANRYQGRLSDEQVGLGTMTGGLGATGSMGSSLMRGRLPEDMENPQKASLDAALAREEQRKAAAGAQGTAMVGGNVVDRDQFQQAWKDRQAMIARGEQGPYAPRLMTGIADRARAALASREATESFAGRIAGDAQAAMNAVPVAPVMAQYQAMGPGVAGPNSMGAMLNRAAAAPVQMPAGQFLDQSVLVPVGVPGMYAPNPVAFEGAWPTGMGKPPKSPFPPGMGKPPVKPPATVTPPTGAAAVPTAPVTPPPTPATTGVPGWPTGMGGKPVAPTTTAPTTTSSAPAGMSTRAKIGTGLAVGGAGVVGYGMMNGQPVAPVLPVGPDQEQVYRSKAFGETTDPVAAQKRMAWDAEVARRKAAVQNRGMAKGEARDLRMGIASPEVVARANLANSPNTMAAMYAAQQEAAARGAEPAMLSQVAIRNTMLTNLQQQWSAATTPEQRAAIEQQMQTIQSQPLNVPQGQSPQEFMQGVLGRGNAVPAGPVVSTYVRPKQGVTAPVQDGGAAPAAQYSGPAIGERPVAPPKTGNIVADANAEAEARRQQAAYDARVKSAMTGDIQFRPEDREVLDNQNITLDQAAEYIAAQWGVPIEIARQSVTRYRSRPMAGPMPNFIPGGTARSRPVARGGF